MSTDDTAFDRERAKSPEEYQVALAAARQENAELRDKYLRAAAAIENARKQAERVPYIGCRACMCVCWRWPTTSSVR
jgi:hypothetical protein